ncbi:histidine triad nucleotide-binding protein [Roseiconus lacunae]|uniref:Histidine triad nucleotide-binding protein n=1 Tax=Roseiconus lacunae TaxID=2605694 RepID=A0ABT7PPX5_9BACT|nr:histidine triad nucleotide-binding protein [Roseiconus lacunae]MCD0462188.1 histidine triad nucleotide-binding protein [Roseiconus lacunae]MDM4018528.1 histidine triad nucleotide-binding protein [Roseiconus lacunae]WRQ49040.1 histidine triad nucleotide-binding protein [Stieleria sp. HD01]
MTTIFKKIIDKEIPAEIVYEDDQCLAFKDIHPKAPVHLLVIPKKEIVSLAHLSEGDGPLVGHCLVALSRIAAEQGLADGYKVAVNCGEAGGQEVPHLHFHLLGTPATK